MTSVSGRRLVKGETQLIKNLSLNKSNEDVRVNFLQHYEFDEKSGEVSKRFSWVSDMEITQADMGPPT